MVGGAKVGRLVIGKAAGCRALVNQAPSARSMFSMSAWRDDRARTPDDELPAGRRTLIEGRAFRKSGKRQTMEMGQSEEETRRALALKKEGPSIRLGRP
jgi:hypothetical protein